MTHREPGRAPVSVVVPSYRDADWLARNLPAVVAELSRRARGDELIVVDDRGARPGDDHELLADALADVLTTAPDARVVVNERNLGFAPSVDRGVREARHALVFLLNPDVTVRAGFLDPLIAALEDPEVAAAAPRVVRADGGADAEALARLAWRRGFPALELADALDRDASSDEEHAATAALPAAFALGGASLWRRDELAGAGAFDPLFAPFYWEDVDRAWRAWRGGRRIVVCPRSVVVHENRGTIGAAVPERYVRAAIEKNRLLFAWKHVDEPRRLTEHLDALRARVLSAAARDDREALAWLCLALEQGADALRARDALPAAVAGFDELRARSDAGRAD